jgi:hypothetical protein
MMLLRVGVMVVVVVVGVVVMVMLRQTVPKLRNL